MKRRKIFAKERLQIFEREQGICHICNGSIHVGELWDISHEIPLELGGEDEGKNLRVAHKTPCHRDHTSKTDVPAIAKAKRRQKKHLGIKKKSTFACSRDSKWKRKIDGTVIKR